MNIESTKYLDKTYSIIIFAEMYVRMSVATFFLPFLIANTIAALVQYTSRSSEKYNRVVTKKRKDQILLFASKS